MENWKEQISQPKYGIKVEKDIFVPVRDGVRLALDVLAARHRPGQTLSSPQCTRAYLRLRLGPLRAEVFGCVFLDTRHRVLAFEELFQGTLNGASVYPREILRRALDHNAGAVILVHNHPSGIAEPSRADESLTQRLTAVLKHVEVRVLDHFVVGDGEVISFAERGLL